MMIRGGNAVDAAIATSLCEGALVSQSSGLGGGFFMTVYNKTTKSCSVIDARETAGENSFIDMFENKTSRLGFLSIAVPGALHGLWSAWRLHGHLNWSSLFQPTIRMCRQGFPVPGSTADKLANKKSKNTINSIADLSTGMAEVLINPDTNEVFKAGEIMRRPVLARTLERLANASDPVELFYRGDIAKMLVSDIQGNGGILTKKDFADYRSKTDNVPIKAQLGHGLVICGPPPPSSAAVLAGLLKSFQHLNLSSDSFMGLTKATTSYHRMIEVMKFAYAARGELGDPAYVEGINELISGLTSDAWAKRVVSSIKDTAQPLSYYSQTQPYFVPDGHGTTHISVVDPIGNAVSLTTSINFFWGAKVRSKSTGLFLNNHMDDFSQPGTLNGFGLPPSPTNFIAPGKRPQSSMSPVVIFDENTGHVHAVAGASGGSRIISAVAYVLARVLWLNETVKQAVDAPRLHNQLQEKTKYDREFPMPLIKLLTKKHGQTLVADRARESSTVLPIAVHFGNDSINASWHSCGDFRKYGARPAGY